MTETIQLQFRSLHSSVFEILAINSGKGNGLLFKPDVLKKACPLGRYSMLRGP